MKTVGEITDVLVYDWRFPTSLKSDGSDAVHKDPDYSCVYVKLLTNSKDTTGFGLTFTLGRGNEIVKATCEALKFLVKGKNFERDILGDATGKGLLAFTKTLTQEGQLRWIGPEKGVIAMACGAIMNAIWDLWSRVQGKPMWEMVVDMEPEQLLELIDFKHITDFITKDTALKLLKSKRPGWQARKAQMKKDGFPAYTTSAGWLGYAPDVVQKLCSGLLKDGHRYFKMKVGSENVQDDIDRARAIRTAIGEDNFLMMDANQKWDVQETIENMTKLSEFRPIWIEEPTNCDDVVGHRDIARALAKLKNPVGVATGEVAQNKVIFKQLLSEDAIEFCQIDSCRMASPSEVLSVLLMASHKDIKVCPHAGGVGLCEYVRHLSMIDYVCFSGSLDGRVCESTTHLHEFFEDKVDFNMVPHKDGKGDTPAYKAPVGLGYAKFHEKDLEEWTYPFGSSWQDESKLNAKLYERAQIARDEAEAPIKKATEGLWFGGFVAGVAFAGLAFAGLTMARK